MWWGATTGRVGALTGTSALLPCSDHSQGGEKGAAIWFRGVLSRIPVAAFPEIGGGAEEVGGTQGPDAAALGGDAIRDGILRRAEAKFADANWFATRPFIAVCLAGGGY